MRSGLAVVPVRQDHGQLRPPGIPSLNKSLMLELARCEFLARRESVLLLGNSGTGKTHPAPALGLAACQGGHRVRFATTAALVSELIEARDEKKLLRFQKQIAGYEPLIVDELGFVPLSKTGAELLFHEWTEVLGSDRLTGSVFDRLTHHVHILEMNADSYRLKQSRRRPFRSGSLAHSMHCWQRTAPCHLETRYSWPGTARNFGTV